MSTNELVAVDRDLLEAKLAKLGFRSDPWLLLRMLLAFLVFYACVVIVPAWLKGKPSRAFDFTGRGLWLRLVIPLLFAAGVFLLSSYHRRRLARLGATEAARRIELEWARLTATGWAGRALLMGLWMGAGVGIPMGVLLMVKSAPGDLIGGSRFLTALAFLGGTLLWTVPMAFLIRWSVLWRYRKLGKRY